MSRYVKLAVVLFLSATVSLVVLFADDAVWGDRNCAVEYCGPILAFVAYPIVVAVLAGLTSGIWSAPKRPSIYSLLVALAVVVPLGVWLIIDLYEGEWRPNVEGDAAFGYAFMLPLWLAGSWLGAFVAVTRSARAAHRSSRGVPEP